MKPANASRRRRRTWLVLVTLAIAVIAAACSASNDSGDEASEVRSAADVKESPTMGDAAEAASYDEDGGSLRVAYDDSGVVLERFADQAIDARVIRDGSIELRIDLGSFAVSSAQIRTIAADLGGYVASGESRFEQFDVERYAVGWFTIRIPSDRFDDATQRVSNLGETVASSLSSQDVTEEYVDLDGRLSYWREQEAFYARLLEKASTIEDLVAVQTRMQDVLLSIEQVEGRLRYLDSRTEFATLTVGLTEVPGGSLGPVEPVEAGPIAKAFDEAGEVLVATVSVMIVATAVIVPIGILALVIYMITRLFVSLRRKDEPVQG